MASSVQNENSDGKCQTRDMMIFKHLLDGRYENFWSQITNEYTGQAAANHNTEDNQGEL